MGVQVTHQSAAICIASVDTEDVTQATNVNGGVFRLPKFRQCNNLDKNYTLVLIFKGVSSMVSRLSGARSSRSSSSLGSSAGETKRVCRRSTTLVK